jgi:hypothetical protein
MDKTECEHPAVKPDRFAALPGVKRYVPGDCICSKCGEPVPLMWNGGKPIPAEQAED